MTYMGALSLFEAGQTSEVVVLRKGATQAFTVTWD